MQEALGYIADHYMAPLPGITGAYPCPEFNAPAHPPKWAQAHKTTLLQECPGVCSEIRRLGLRDLQEVIQQFTSGNLALTYPATCKLLQLASVLPLGTASVERLFSKLRLVFTRLRQLRSESLATVLFVGVECREYSQGIPEATLARYLGYPERMAPPSRRGG